MGKDHEYFEEGEIPDELEEGYHFFVYNVMVEGKEGFGCFIGQSPQDVLNIPELETYRGEERVPVRVIRVKRAEYIEAYNMIKTAHINAQLEAEMKNNNRPAI